MTYHEVQPKVGTTVREADGRPADLMNRADYPVIGECMGCGEEIRLGFFWSPIWEHVKAAVPPRNA